MTADRKGRRRVGLVATLVALAAGLVFVFVASSASLPGSHFEIDSDAPGANLKVDGTSPAPSVDWASVSQPPEARQQDATSGRNDDSYQGGVKEDTACPAETTGSIPNNKSDLLTFGAYVEPEVGGPGYLNLFWRRVNDPSGTTLMDFELNQSGQACANSPNKVRTPGDLLIEYSIDQGGAQATITAREWSGSAWGEKIPLPGQALGTINNVAIPAAESDGLSASAPLAARTFGEMQLDLDFIFDSESCESFGSAMLKSRSSDSFTSQLKDFIRPVPVNISNCGKVIIRKQTDPDEADNSTLFGYTKVLDTDPASDPTFQLADDGVQEYDVLLGSGYSVVEDVVGAGYDFDNVNCSASTGVTPSIAPGSALVEFAIDSAQDILDCTYTNKARGTIIIKKVTDDGNGTFSFVSNSLDPAAWDLTTAGPGDPGDSRTFSDLAPGQYDAAESPVPNGWNLVSSSCDDANSTPSEINLEGGETVTCTFHNAREQGAILITKLRKHAADGAGDHPHPQVEFNVSGGLLPAGGVNVSTDSSGLACVDGLTLSAFDGVGNYTVTEDLPAGYRAAQPLAQVVSVVAEGNCDDGPHANVNFLNIPQTDLLVRATGQVEGGTRSSIECVDANGDDIGNSPVGLSDPAEMSALGLLPGEYDCHVVIDP